MNLPSPRRGLTEWALRFLVNVRSSRPDSRPHYGRFLGGGSFLEAPPGSRPGDESIFFRIMTLLEAYVDSLYMELLVGKLPSPNETLLQLMEEAERTVSGNWRAREEGYRRVHAIELERCDSWSELRAGREVRNALGHGLGRLGVSQRRKSTLARQLAVLDVQVSDGRLHLSSSSVDKIASHARLFICSLDEKT